MKANQKTLLIQRVEALRTELKSHRDDHNAKFDDPKHPKHAHRETEDMDSIRRMHDADAKLEEVLAHLKKIEAS